MKKMNLLMMLVATLSFALATVPAAQANGVAMALQESQAVVAGLKALQGAEQAKAIGSIEAIMAAAGTPLTVAQISTFLASAKGSADLAQALTKASGNPVSQAQFQALKVAAADLKGIKGVSGERAKAQTAFSKLSVSLTASGASVSKIKAASSQSKGPNADPLSTLMAKKGFSAETIDAAVVARTASEAAAKALTADGTPSGGPRIDGKIISDCAEQFEEGPTREAITLVTDTGTGTTTGLQRGLRGPKAVADASVDAIEQHARRLGKEKPAAFCDGVKLLDECSWLNTTVAGYARPALQEACAN